MPNVATLASVADVFNGKTPAKSEHRESGFPVLKIRDIDAAGQFKGVFESFVEPAFANRFVAKHAQIGDVLVLNAAHNASHVASKTHRVEDGNVGALITGEWLTIRPDVSQLEGSYLAHWVTSAPVRAAMKDCVKGIHLYPKDVAQLKIPLPPLSEQRRIAAILDQADTVRTRRRQRDVLLHSVEAAIFQSIFGPESSGPRCWRSMPLKALSLDGLKNGAYFPKERYSDDGIEMVHMADAFYDLIPRGGLRRVSASSEEIEKYAVIEGDVLIARRSLNYAGAGKPSLAATSSEPLLFESSLIRMRLDPSLILKEYLFGVLSSKEFKRTKLSKIVTGTTIFGVSQSNMGELAIPIPPMELQNRYRDILTEFRRMSPGIDTFASELDHLFASLQSRAFRGEL